MDHEKYMRMALELAAQAEGDGDVPVGCVIVKDGQVIGRVVNVSADESVLGADGKVDPEKLNVILYDGIQMTYRAVGPVVAQAFSAGKALK